MKGSAAARDWSSSDHWRTIGMPGASPLFTETPFLKRLFERYLDGVLLQGIDSVPVLTLPGQTSTINMVIDVPNRGTYKLTGQANFDGTESNSRSLTFRVGSTSIMWLLIGILGGIVLIASVSWIAWRARGRREKRPDRGVPHPLPSAPPPTGVPVPTSSSQGQAGWPQP